MAYKDDSSAEKLAELFTKVLYSKLGCHYGITCDSCGNEKWFGYRYKCAICNDYDLCSNCFEDRKESKAHKSSHPLKVIRSPDTFSKFQKVFSLGLPKLQELLCEKNVMHDVACSICDDKRKVKGLLFICDDCRGYRLCYNCYSQNKVSSEHKSDHCLLIRVTPRSYKITGANITLEKKLGAGSFGEVYKCDINGSTAAIKMCKTKDLSTLTGGERKSLENEIEIYQEFFCDYIVEIAGFGMGTGNRLFLILEYLSSGNLEAHIRSDSYSSVSKRRRFFYCENIIRGLFRMHKKGIIHKDLKPDNIFLTDHDTIKLGDLGIAFNPDSTSTEVKNIRQQIYYPRTDANCFHPTYDIYAFGLIFNEIMTSKRDTRLTQAECKDPNVVPYFGTMISACISEYGKDRPTTQCVKEHMLKFHTYLDHEIENNGKPYKSESLDKRNEIFDKAYKKFAAKAEFVKETDQNYQRVPRRQDAEVQELMRSLLLLQLLAPPSPGANFQIEQGPARQSSSDSEDKKGSNCSLM